VNLLERRHSELSYSIEEAQAYSRAHVRYCDRMEAMYQDANMASLRRIAGEFLAATEREPLDWRQVKALQRRLQAGVGAEGSGWLLLLNYVTHFIKAGDTSGGR
jgi:hypothetical protein